MLTQIKVEDNQIFIRGSNLQQINKIEVDDAGIKSQLEIVSKNSNEIVAHASNPLTFAVGKLLNFILSNAHASSSVSIDFSLCDARLGGRRFDCSVVPNDKEVLTYDASTQLWRPRALNGLSYKGAWDANGPFPVGASEGDYYIVSVASGSYDVGDWIVFNGTSFDEIDNANSVVSVFGRIGAVSAAEGDYNLDQLADVDLSIPPILNQTLIFDGTNWLPGNVAETDPSVEGFAKSALPNCDPGEFLSANGTSLTCVAESSAGIPATASRVVITDASAVPAVSSVTTTELGHLTGVSSNVQTQLDAKADSASIEDWSAAGILTIDPSRLNLGATATGVVVSSSGTLSTSGITATELDFLDGVTSNIQDQLDDKLDSSLASNIFTQYGNAFGANAVIGTSDNYPLIFGTNNTARMTLSQTGDLGIGVGSFSPAARLHVASELTQSVLIHKNSNNNNGAEILFLKGRGVLATPAAVAQYDRLMGLYAQGYYSTGLFDYSANVGGIQVLAAENFSATNQGTYMDFGTTAIGTTSRVRRMMIRDNGNVGIGDIPENSALIDERLVVDGNIKSSGNISAAGCLESGTTTHGVCASDERIKKDVKSFSLGLNVVLGLNPVSYKYNGLAGYPESDKEKLGVIAQQVERVAPELVHTKKVKLHPSDERLTEIKTVNYGGFTYALINAVQDLHRLIIGNEEKNERAIQDLKTENDALKAYICHKDPTAPFCP